MASIADSQPSAGEPLRARPPLERDMLAARLATAGDLTADEVAELARLDDGPDVAGDPCDSHPAAAPAPPGCGASAARMLCADELADAPPPEWLALPDDEHASLLRGGEPVAEALEAGFTHRVGGTGAGFAAGGPLDVMLPGEELAWHAGQARRRGLGACSDDELAGLGGAAARLESWAGELKLAVVAELDARRAGPGGREGEHVTEEVAAMLTLTGRSATSLVELSRRLERLDATRAMLAAGLIDTRRAAVIADHTALLPEEHAVAVQDAVLPYAAGMTTGQLAAACQRAVLACDPQGAIRRRERAQQDARVETWAEAAGTAALAGRDLPPAAVIAADKTLDADAAWLKAHGVPGSHDQLRAAAYTARLTGQPLATLLPPGSASGADPAAGGGGFCGPAREAGATSGLGGWPATGMGGSVNLTMPAATWLGRSDAPGEIPGTGPADAGTCREVAAALAVTPATRWCVTVTDNKGRAIGHGCARHGPGPPGSGDPAAWLATVKITPVETGTCTHRRETASYQPPDTLRHIIKIRSRRCGFPGCRRPAIRCDDDHTIPHHNGGKTCECNLHPLCRRHHHTKQAPGWRLGQPEPGLLIWTTPSGRKLTVTPEPYPT